MPRRMLTKLLYRIALLAAGIVITPHTASGDDAEATAPFAQPSLERQIEVASRFMIEQWVELDKLRSAKPEDEETRTQTRREIGKLEQRLNHQAVALQKLLLRREAERGASSPEDLRNVETIAALQAQLVERDDALVEMRTQLQEAHEQLDESDRLRELPKLENATLKVFRLKYLQAATAAQTIVSILGERDVRVAPDDRANALVVAADEESAKLIEALLMQLDVDSLEPEDGEQPAAASSQARSLLLRTYWLADGLPEGEGEDAGQFLPGSVLKAMEGLGLKEPRLVCQTVNALKSDGSGDQASKFDTRVPAILFKQQAQLKCVGFIRSVRGDRAEVEASIEVQAPSISTELSGSLAMPLGHYMVLGTANSVSYDPAQVASGGMMSGMEGMGMPMGGGGDAFDDATVRGGGGGEFGGLSGRGMEGGGGMPADPAAAGMRGAAPGPKYNTSHFAFVVQIIEGESFPAEE